MWLVSSRDKKGRFRRTPGRVQGLRTVSSRASGTAGRGDGGGGVGEKEGVDDSKGGLSRPGEQARSIPSAPRRLPRPRQISRVHAQDPAADETGRKDGQERHPAGRRRAALLPGASAAEPREQPPPAGAAPRYWRLGARARFELAVRVPIGQRVGDSGREQGDAGLGRAQRWSSAGHELLRRALGGSGGDLGRSTGGSTRSSALRLGWTRVCRRREERSRGKGWGRSPWSSSSSRRRRIQQVTGLGGLVLAAADARRRSRARRAALGRPDAYPWAPLIASSRARLSAAGWAREGVQEDPRIGRGETKLRSKAGQRALNEPPQGRPSRAHAHLESRRDGVWDGCESGTSTSVTEMGEANRKMR